MPQVWNTATPAGTDPKSQGDDRIREMKDAIQAALRGQADEGDEAIFPGNAAATAPVFRHRGRKGTTAQRPAAGQYGQYFDTTRNVLQRDNGTTWEDIATNIPSGTKMVFFQAAAPVGWAIDATHTGKVLRVVSATGGGTGGTHDPATAITLAHSHTVNIHTHAFTTASAGGHSHTVNSHTHDLGNHTHSTPNHQHLLDHDVVPNVDNGANTSGVTSNDTDGGYLRTAVVAGVQSRRLVKNRTQDSGAGTSGAPSSNTSGAAAPGTDTQGAHTHTGTTDATSPGTNSQLSNISLAYIDVLVCTKS